MNKEQLEANYQQIDSIFYLSTVITDIMIRCLKLEYKSTKNTRALVVLSET